jgi:hypothetical protein
MGPCSPRLRRRARHQVEGSHLGRVLTAALLVASAAGRLLPLPEITIRRLASQCQFSATLIAISELSLVAIIAIQRRVGYDLGLAAFVVAHLFVTFERCGSPHPSWADLVAFPILWVCLWHVGPSTKEARPAKLAMVAGWALVLLLLGRAP